MGAHVWTIIMLDSAVKPNNNNGGQLFSCQISLTARACIPSISWGACCESALKLMLVHQAILKNNSIGQAGPLACHSLLTPGAASFVICLCQWVPASAQLSLSSPLELIILELLLTSARRHPLIQDGHFSNYYLFIFKELWTSTRKKAVWSWL